MGCPVCGSVRVVIVLSDGGRSWCTRCGPERVQEGSLQRRVKRAS